MVGDEARAGRHRANALAEDVPRQVSIVGFDGLPDMPCQLTTVVQYIEQIALAAIQSAEEMIVGGARRSVVVPFTLRVGATTALSLTAEPGAAAWPNT